MERGKEAGARHQVQGLWSRESTSSTLITGREAQHEGTKVGMSNKVWEKAGSTNCQAWPLRKCCLDKHPDCLFLTWQKIWASGQPLLKNLGRKSQPRQPQHIWEPCPSAWRLSCCACTVQRPSTK